MRSLVVSAVALGVVLLAPPLAAAADAGHPAFRFQTFDVPGATGTQVNGINDQGTLEGSFTDGSGQHGFISSRGKLIRFDFPGTSGVTQAFAIDNAGDVVGVYSDAAGAYHGFLRTSGGAISALPSPAGAGSGSGQGTFPAGINGRGEIAGYYIGPDGVAHGYRESPGGEFTTVDAAGAGAAAGQGTFIFSLNDAGVACGGYVTSGNQEFGLVEQAGRISVVNDPATPQDSSGGTDAVGTAGGVIAGDFASQQGSELGYVLAHGEFTTVADPLGAGGPPAGTVVTATNSRLALSGYYTTSSGAQHGFIAFPARRP